MLAAWSRGLVGRITTSCAGYVAKQTRAAALPSSRGPTLPVWCRAFGDYDRGDRGGGSGYGRGGYDRDASRHRYGSGGRGSDRPSRFGRRDMEVDIQDSDRGGGGGFSGICYDFMRGECRRGDSCKFSHDPQLAEDSKHNNSYRRNSRRPDRDDDVNSNSFDGDRGGGGGGSRNACYDFMRGECRRGDSCKFSHDPQLVDDSRENAGYRRDRPRWDDDNAGMEDRVADPTGGMCHDFLRGSCNRGPKCKFSHDPAGNTPAARSAAFSLGRGDSRGGNRPAHSRVRDDRGPGRWSDTDPAPVSWSRKANPEDPDKYAPVGEYLCGMSQCLAAVMAGRRVFHRLYVREEDDESSSARPEHKHRLKLLLKTAGSLGIPVEYVSKYQLGVMSVSLSSAAKNVVLDASPFKTVPIDSLGLPADGTGTGVRPPLWLCLDEIQDPQNTGAILRSVLFFGCDGVIICEKNTSPLNGTVARSSSGALEYLTIHSVDNMPNFLTGAAAAGWKVMGTSVRPGVSKPLSSSALTGPTLVVFGNEGRGMRTNIERACTDLIQIPRGAFHGSADLKAERVVDSLNVSVAAAVVLAHLLDEGKRGLLAVNPEDYIRAE